MKIGYHASHEQFSPSELLTYVQAAEDAGFQAIMTSDHIAPWSIRQGNAGNNWAWMGAAMARTSLPFGSLAIPGGWRYHPVVLAHLVATLAEMFPNRLRWIAAGSGEALNEHMVGGEWPAKDERNARLLAATEIVRNLWKGDEVSRVDPWFETDRARLWSLPETPPKIYGAALTDQTAEWTGSWADGLITVRKSPSELAAMIDRFRAGGGTGKPLALQIQVCWDTDRDRARMAAWDQWRNAALPSDLLADLPLPEDFDARTQDMKPGEIDAVIPLVTSADELLELIHDCSACGFEDMFIHNISRDQLGFIRFMGRDVLPALE